MSEKNAILQMLNRLINEDEEQNLSSSRRAEATRDALKRIQILQRSSVAITKHDDIILDRPRFVFTGVGELPIRWPEFDKEEQP